MYKMQWLWDVNKVVLRFIREPPRKTKYKLQEGKGLDLRPCSNPSAEINKPKKWEPMHNAFGKMHHY